MPRSNGVFTLPPVYHAVPGTTIRAEQHNAPLEDVAAALTASLPRDGSAPMVGPLNMNGRKITGLGAATASGDAARFDQIPTVSEWQESVAALTMSADRFPYATGESSAALAVLTAFARTLLAAVAAGDARAVLGLTISDTALAVLNATVAHNDADWRAGTATTPGLPSPAQVVMGNIGVGQTWQTPTRVANTDYTNATGKPIMASITVTGVSGTDTYTAIVGGVTVSHDENLGAEETYSVSFIVPAGNIYRLNTTGGAFITVWAELR